MSQYFKGISSNITAYDKFKDHKFGKVLQVNNFYMGLLLQDFNQSKTVRYKLGQSY